MDQDEKLTKQVDEFATIGKENPNVNVSMLMLNALENQKTNFVSGKAKKWAYLISVGVPPLGLLVALYYYFDNKDDSNQVMWTCVILTAIAIVVFWITLKLFFSGSGTSVEQIEQIKPSDIYQLSQ